MNFADLTLEESQKLNEMLLREPDQNMKLFAKRLLGKGEKVSLPICYELLLMDNTSEDIIQELLRFYCENATRQYEIVSGENKRKTKEQTKLKIKVRRSSRLSNKKN